MASLARDGYAVADLVLTAGACETIASELPAADARRGGVRHMLRLAAVQRLLESPRFAGALRTVVDGPLTAVRATLFDKTPNSNWRVQWHQDRVIAVRERAELAGYGPWSVKGAVVHVDAPVHVLAAMLAEKDIREVASSGPQVELTVPRGAVLLMHPLLLHASGPATEPLHRRVLHIELAPEDVIAPLRWPDDRIRVL